MQELCHHPQIIRVQGCVAEVAEDQDRINGELFLYDAFAKHHLDARVKEDVKNLYVG